METYRIGLDVGSTTAKIAVVDGSDKIVFSKYIRHQADIFTAVSSLTEGLYPVVGDGSAMLALTGSVGMGLAERFSLPFVQEVTAAARFARKNYPDISTMIDIGGEDAKIVYLDEKGNADLRMNGNCAGGTGAFIDQMALLLGVAPDEMDALAGKARRIYPIASRCGVFSKTDVQNLVSRNVSKADIAASIFHAVAVQTVVTLSHGCDIKPRILFCGGPLNFFPSLRKAFADYLQLPAGELVTPEHANIVPAWGTALCCPGGKTFRAGELAGLFRDSDTRGTLRQTRRLAPLFDSGDEYERWKAGKRQNPIESAPLETCRGKLWIGIDSGSTTTKIVATDDLGRLVFSHYAPNEGNPVEAVRTGLDALRQACDAAGIDPSVAGSCSTGYGEDLIRAAFGLDTGIVETLAHYLSARKIDPEVSFILDIGGQDMKAMFIENGTLRRMEINEACSSGCGSFIGTFAKSLDYTAESFAQAACLAQSPCDLGTRCTVFMNSRVKQVLREGATVADIAAGLSYSVAKNCLYKVLKLKDLTELGRKIVVQGGTMRNDSVVRAFERLTGQQVSRSDVPELMGAYGCALHARATAGKNAAPLNRMLESAVYEVREQTCRGCENRCAISKYRFGNDNIFYSGNKCEKIFSNAGTKAETGENASAEKYELLFGREKEQPENPSPTLGIPRILNMYEEYPFWHALFRTAGIRTVLSAPSTFVRYEAGVHSVMSDNICFPAKLVHSHIYDLTARKPDRIFMPYVIFEKKEDDRAANSYNCPIVSGYSDVIRSAVNPSVPLDTPAVSFRDPRLLRKSCREYLRGLGISDRIIRQALRAAETAREQYEKKLAGICRGIFERCRQRKGLTILLAGRPYHTDPLVQHKVSEMIAAMGAAVVTEDIVREEGPDPSGETNMVSQWAYTNRILKAALWAARQGNDVHFVQITSFGCGPDAFLLDEVADILRRHGKSLTVLKVDDVNNIGSLKLRVRSLVENLRLQENPERHFRPFVPAAKFTDADKGRKILVPFFTDYVSPMIAPLFSLAGYDLEVLPPSDTVSADYGLQYANNEVCYPATLIVGDLVKALKSGRYDPSQTAVAITQTGGQCRASNYFALIKSGLAAAGFPEVPVLPLAFGSGLDNGKSGFRVNWAKIIRITLDVVLYGDCISRFYHATAVRERTPGEARRLRDRYLEAAAGPIRANDPAGLQALLAEAAEAFDTLPVSDEELPRVGIVGEIFLKFNAFANKHTADWLMEKGIEVVPPMLTGFFMQSFVNRKVRHRTHVTRDTTPAIVTGLLYRLAAGEIGRFNRIGAGFRRFTPFPDIFDEARHAEQVVSLSAQFGEGWLLPAEIISFARAGINNVVSLQPFGCIANHIVAKGIEKRIKALYPQMNLLSLDFDGGVSDVNVANRLHLMADHLK